MLAALFEVDAADWNDPRFNIAPQVRIVTVRERKGHRLAQSLLWGARNPRDTRPLINARSETVATSPLFAKAFAASRVLVPADGFFEWTRDGRRRLGRYFQQPGRGPFAFAGIAVNPETASQAQEPAAVILTTQASDSVKAYHDRMPLMVAPGDFGAWLDSSADLGAALAVVNRGAATSWTSHPVGPAVNNVRNDSIDCVKFAEPLPDRQGSLF
jgi:putative SOS response-associated peptidase YedK